MAGQSWKKLDPALLRDDPTDTPTSTSPDRILPGISPERVLREIKGMLVGDDFGWAEGTLRGILAEIERTEAVTAGQWATIERIVDKPRNQREKRGRRWRY